MSIRSILITFGTVAAALFSACGGAVALEDEDSQASTYGASVLPRTGPEAVNKLALSPDGKQIAVAITDGEDFFVTITDIDGSSPRALPKLITAEPIYIAWPSDDYVIVGYRRTRLTSRDVASSEKRFKSITHAIVYEFSTSENWMLNWTEGDDWSNYTSLPRIGNFDTYNENVLIDYGGGTVLRNLKSRKETITQYDSYYSDIENVMAANGRLRLSVRDANNRLNLRCMDENDRLQQVYSKPISRDGWPLQPVAPGEGEGESYLLERDENGVLSRLVTFDCLNPESFNVVVDADGAQIEGVFFNVHEQRVYGVWASGEIPAFTYFDDALAAQVEAVSTALGGSVHIWPVDFSRDGKSFVLYARPIGMEIGVFVHVEERGGQLAVTQLLNEGSLSR